MNIRNYIAPILLLVALASGGCRRIADTLAGDKLLARAGDQSLYLSEVGSIFAAGITPEDSVRLLQSYVDMWVKKQLKTTEAERHFSESAPDIDRMVEEYRSTLLGRKLDNYYIERRLDTLFSNNEITEYYNENRHDFLLDRAIVRGRMVCLPDNYRQRGRLKELLKWSSDASKQDFMDICQKNGFVFRDFSEWCDYSDFLDAMPVDRQRSEDITLRTDGVQEASSGGKMCYFIITDRRREGDSQPLERVEANIRKVLVNRRTAEIIRSYEDSIYQAAKVAKKIVINVE